MAQIPPYPPHLSDPFRRRIAQQYVKHELIKLFPGIRDKGVWDTIEREIAAWFEENPTLADVRDFWNGVHAVSMGFKLKRLVPWITSLHVNWTEQELPTDELWFATVLDEFPSLDRPMSAQAVKKWYFAQENRQALLKAHRTHEELSNQTAPRDNSPLIVKRDGPRLFAYDGNRRLFRAVVLQEPAVRAFVGEPVAQPEIFEHWVPTQVLLELVEFSRGYPADRDSLEATAYIIANLVHDSSVGRFELANRCLMRGNQIDIALRNTVAEILKIHSISLPRTGSQ